MAVAIGVPCSLLNENIFLFLLGVLTRSCVRGYRFFPDAPPSACQCGKTVVKQCVLVQEARTCLPEVDFNNQNQVM
jgi:hypothetical protein